MIIYDFMIIMIIMIKLALISTIQANFIPIQVTKQNKLTKSDKFIAASVPMNAIVRSNRQAVYFMLIFMLMKLLTLIFMSMKELVLSKSNKTN